MKLKLALILGGTAIAVPVIVGTTVAVVQSNSHSSNDVVDNNNGSIGDNNQGDNNNENNQNPGNGDNGNDQNSGNTEKPDNGNNDQTTPENVVASYKDIQSSTSIKIKKLDVNTMNEYVNSNLSSFKTQIENTSTSINIVVNSFSSSKTTYTNNVFTLVFNVVPKQNANWDDKTTVSKELTVKLTNVSLSDELIATIGQVNLTYTTQISLSKATIENVNSYVQTNLNTFKTFITNQNGYKNVDVSAFNSSETKTENANYTLSFSVAPKNGYFWSDQQTTIKKINVVLSNVVDEQLIKEQKTVQNFYNNTNYYASGINNSSKTNFIKSLIEDRYFNSGSKQDRVDFGIKLLSTTLYFRDTLPKNSGVAYRYFYTNNNSLIVDTYNNQDVSYGILSTSNIDDIQLISSDSNSINFKVTFKNVTQDSDGFYGYIAQASKPAYYNGKAMYPSFPLLSNTMTVKLNTKFIYGVNGIAGNKTYYDTLDQFYTDAAKTKTGSENNKYIHIGLGLMRNESSKNGYDLLFSGRVKKGDSVQLQQNGYIIEINSNDGKNPKFNTWAWSNMNRFISLFCINDIRW